MDIFDDGILLAKHIPSKDLGASGLTFHSLPDDGIQVGVWNYGDGQILQPHIHNLHQKVANRTAEVLYVIKGSVHVDIYSENSELLREFSVSKGDVLICLAGGHGYRILEEGTLVLEVKNGPYFGPEVDRRRIEQQCQS